MLEPTEIVVKGHVLSLHAADQADLTEIPAIELSAAKRFASVPACEFLISYDPRSEDDYRHIQQEGLLGVASVGREGPRPEGPRPEGPTAVGFIAVIKLGDGGFHVEEFGVNFEWQGSGVGAALMDWFEGSIKNQAESGQADTVRVSLTTSKLTAWSFEWYRKRGYREIEAAELGPEVAEILAKEQTEWPNEFGRSRVAMVKVIEIGGG